MKFERHEAVVSTNEDPELRGRIKVLCPSLTGDEVTALPVWCEPVPSWGWFVVPDIGETVEIEVMVQDDLDEIYGQASFEDYIPKWRGKRFITDAELEDDGDGSVASPVHSDFTSEAYGKRRGFATPHGHVLLFDDTEGAPRVYITMQKDKLEPGAAPEPTGFCRLEFTSEGKVSIALLGGATLLLEGNAASAVATLGDGAKSAAIAEALQTYIDDSVKAEFDAHVHPTGMGPSGAPTVPLTGYDSAITSSKLKIPDG